MRRLHLLVLLLAGFTQAGLSAQEIAPLGRWVNIDATDFPLFVLVFEPNLRVHRLMPAPQFQATYSVEGEQLVLRMGDGSSATFVLRGDTLAADGGAAYIRLSGSADETGVGGTWRQVPGGSRDQFMTLRSDGQVVLEVGFPVQATVSADTLQLSSPGLPSVSFTLYQLGDTLHVEDATGKHRRFLRRPWGCFGIEAFEAGAAECH